MRPAQINSILSSNDLRIIKLGSEVGATKNMTVYESGDDIIVVDCGIGYPDTELPGVDIVIPDIAYLLENKQYLHQVIQYLDNLYHNLQQ